MDVLQVFVRADAKVTKEEEMVLEELTGLIEQYVDEDATERTMFEVLIVPQNDEQVSAIADLIPGAQMTTLRGGSVFPVGRFFSANYAEVVCEKYIALGLFTTHVAA